MTHPDYRNQGFAFAAVQRCIEFFHEQGDIDIGLLVCKPQLIPLYQRMGWQDFCGTLLVTQKGKQEIFTFNRVMTFPVRKQENVMGTIDLLGPPW